MSDKRQFRRPARLEPQDAEAIVGDEDPAAESELAHTTAWALMGVPSGDFDEEAVARLQKTVRDEGVDLVAPAWDRSPDFTLPGALWRLYLVWQWYQLDPEVIKLRFQEGMDQIKIEGVTDPSTVPPMHEVIRGVEGVLAGYAGEKDLAPVLESTAGFLRVLATGVEYGPEWITQDDHVLAHTVTRRPKALLATAAELDESARQAALGELE